jgi:hypothetical protein
MDTSGMVGISGLEGLQRELEKMQEAAKALELPIKISVNPDDPADAVREMEAEVDRRLAPYGASEPIRSLGQHFKAESKAYILRRVSDARTKAEEPPE